MKTVKRPVYPKILSAIFLLLIVAAVIGGVVATGGPAYQRKLRLDEKRLQALQQLQGSIEQYWLQKRHLPERLEALTYGQERVTDWSPPSSWRDPETNESYEYQVRGADAYALCATFLVSSEKAEQDTASREAYGLYEADRWRHPAGRYCFDFTAPPLPPVTPPGGSPR